MRRVVSFVVALTVVAATAPADAGPDGQITWGVHTTLVPCSSSSTSGFGLGPALVGVAPKAWKLLELGR
jgi:hypothetical protein